MITSNKLILALIVVFIGVTLFTQYSLLSQSAIKIMGAASTDTGTATLTIGTAGSIRFAVNAIDFGSGSVNTSSGNTQCILDTNGTNESSQCISFSANTTYFQLENDGTANVTVQLLSNKDASAFFGGTATLASFRYAVFNNESQSCRNGTGGTGTVGQIGGGAGNCTAADDTAGNCTVSPMGWTDVNSTGVTGATICQRLLFTDLNDSIGFDINITIPYDAPSGAKSATFTATATSTT